MSAEPPCCSDIQAIDSVLMQKQPEVKRLLTNYQHYALRLLHILML